MENYKKKGAGGFKGGKSFGQKRPWDRSSSDRGSDLKMYKADCAECRRTCDVPFKPNGKKPVYCSACFSKNKGGDSREFRQNNSRLYGNDERRVFKTDCDACGRSCEVPFKPNGSKPVYCSACFDNKGMSLRKSRPEVRVSDPHVEQFRSLHAKLDTVIKLLSPSSETEKIEKKAAKVGEKVEKAQKVTKAKKDPKAPVKKKAVMKKKPAVKKKK